MIGRLEESPKTSRALPEVGGALETAEKFTSLLLARSLDFFWPTWFVGRLSKQFSGN